MADIQKRSAVGGVRWDVRYRDESRRQRKKSFERKVDAQRFAASVETDPGEAQRLLAALRRDVQGALEKTRALADRLYPPLLEAGGLRVALRSAAAGADVPIRIDISTEGACPVEITSAVYFCCLDVLERAGARTPVAVTVRDEEGTLAFEVVADCDVGADLPSRDRVEALGGRLTIQEGPDHQTRLVGSLPLSG